MRNDVVGREEELAEIEAFLRSPGELPRVLLLEGEAGIGKTTLWRSGTAAAQAAYRVLSCSPSESEIQLSFTAAGDLLGDVAEEALTALPPPQRRALAAALLLEDVSGPPPDQRAVALAFFGGLRALAAAGPIVVAVDDVQWLDRSSALLLEFALRRVREEPIGFLLARRSRPGARPPLGLDRALSGRVQQVEVGPLTLGALHRLLRTRLGTALPRPLLRRLHEASGGNPFYALELGRTLKDRGAELEPGRPLPVPETLQEIVRERIAAQPAEVREALAATAALSRPTVFAVGAARALDAAAEAGLIELDGERVRFTHPLLAAEAYAAAGAEQRRRIHRRLADVSSDPEEHARHLALATQEPSEEVAVALDAAASQAAGRGAPDAAAELSELAERLTPREVDSRLLDRQLQTIDYRYQAGAMDAARASLDRLLAQMPPGRDRAAVLMRLALVREDDVNAVVGICHQALTESGGDDQVDAEIHGVLSVVSLILGDVGRACASARSAVECAERLGTPESLAAALGHLGMMDTLAGERPSDEFWERAVALEREVDRSIEQGPSQSRGLHLMYADRLDEARTSLEEAYRRAAAHGHDGSLMNVELFLTELECRAGQLQQAGRHADSLYQTVGQTGHEQTEAVARYAKAMVDAYLGRVDDARAGAEEGVASAEALNDTIFRTQNLAVLGFLELSLGDAAAADRHLRPLWPLLASMGYGEPSVYPVLPNAIEALIGIGELEEAVTLLDQLEERGRALDSAWALSQAARCRGLLAAARGDPEAAVAEFERALAENERMPGPFERGRTLLAQGATLRRLKRRRDARESLEQARAIFEEMGARLWAEKARAELARIGGRAPSAGALTPTEQRVAELVAEGRSNKEVARELFVTVKTVERNLSRVYEKLGIRSRAELARRYAREEPRAR